MNLLQNYEVWEYHQVLGAALELVERGQDVKHPWQQLRSTVETAPKTIPLTPYKPEYNCVTSPAPTLSKEAGDVDEVE